LRRESFSLAGSQKGDLRRGTARKEESEQGGPLSLSSINSIFCGDWGEKEDAGKRRVKGNA